MLNLAKKCLFAIGFCFFSHHLAYAQNALQSEEEFPLILGGQYLDEYNTMLPILYISHDLASKWEYKINTTNTLPLDFKTDGLISFSHNEENISIIGGHYSDEERRYPLIGRSENYGVDWQYPIQKTGAPENLPAHFDDEGAFRYLSCHGSRCASIGEYEANNGHIYPMLAMSQDAGLHWNFPIDGNHLPPGFTLEGYLNGVYCAKHLCLTVGEYRTNQETTHPMALISDGKGKHWDYIVDHTVNTPANYAQHYGVFRKAYCTEHKCIASGIYMNRARKTLPMIAVGSSKEDWVYKIEYGPHLPADYHDYYFMHDMGCENNMCAVIGSYEDESYNQYATLIVTTDAGENWKYQIDKTEDTLPFDFEDNGQLSKISCSKKICAAVGRYKAHNLIQYPLITISTDQGETWKYAIQKGLNEPPPPFTNSGSLSNVHCHGKRCAATGFYVDDRGATLPLVVETDDLGETWHYRVGGGDLPLPDQYKSSPSFMAVKCTKDLCYAGGRYVDAAGRYFPMLAVGSTKNEPWKFIVDGANELPPHYSNSGYFTNR